VWSGSKASYTAPEPAKSITTMPGARAFGLLRQGIADCVSAGVSASDDVVSDSIALWCALHGYVALSSRSPAFPWPPQEEYVLTAARRNARLTEQPNCRPTDRLR